MKTSDFCCAQPRLPVQVLPGPAAIGVWLLPKEGNPAGSCNGSLSSDTGTPRLSCIAVRVACSHSPPGWSSAASPQHGGASSGDPSAASKTSLLCDAASAQSSDSPATLHTSSAPLTPSVLPESNGMSHTAHQSSSPPQHPIHQLPAAQSTLCRQRDLSRRFRLASGSLKSLHLSALFSASDRSSPRIQSISRSPSMRVLCNIDGVFLDIPPLSLLSTQDLNPKQDLWASRPTPALPLKTSQPQCCLTLALADNAECLPSCLPPNKTTAPCL